MDELIKEAKELLNDGRSGFRDSSHFNRTEYALLGLIYKAHDLGMESNERNAPKP